VRRLMILAVLIGILIVGGGLTQQLIRDNGNLSLPTIQQTNDPNGDPAQMTPWKAEQLILVIMFILFSPMPPGLIPMAIGLLALFWFLDWQVKRVKLEKRPSAEKSPAVVEPQQTGVEST
jgi:hypothetical protein